MFYISPLKLFKNSIHIFDEEKEIEKLISNLKFIDDEKELLHYVFKKSEEDKMIQLSDVIAGLLGKYFDYIKGGSFIEIEKDIKKLKEHEIEYENLILLHKILKKSEDKCIGFLHNTCCIEEQKKISYIFEMLEEDLY
ncbi:hypothetical protein [Haliovirga abyssi]|uniref:Uncharacterized protein n=1 Tax=Haliovirga abyssi TaxID=2996794 RepID=A0AAU9DPN1_9FUSO|nr:hypothetical protein [Haliovirga abyssi]BDU50398.1 hypothetical protein HLVA_09670 [Haliovirga abyssi]